MALISTKRLTRIRPGFFASIFTLAATLAIALVALQGGSPLQAQTAPAAPAIRIVEAVDNSSRVTLKGNVHPLARPQFDHGAAPGALPANRLTLVLKRSDQQEAALRQFLEATQDRKSPQYHNFLTPEQFGKQYGPADADLQTITNWLGSQGFTVAKINQGRTAIEFSGTVDQVQKAFHTSIHSYVVNGEQHYANAIDPQIPSALAPVVAGIAQLNNFKPQRMIKVFGQAKMDRATHKATPLFNDPAFGSNGALEGYYLAVTPGDFSVIYDTKPLLAGGTDGTGVTIAIAGDSNIDPTAVQNFRTNFLPGYSATAFSASNIIVDGVDPGINGDGIEAYLDVELAGGVAPNATVNLYTSNGNNLSDGLELAITRAIEDNTADILNISFGEAEAFLGNAGNASLSNAYEQAAAQGITIFVSTGDSGSAAADDSDTETSAVNGLQVSGFASTPFNVAVGGTDFVYPADVSEATLNTYWNASTPTNPNNNSDFSSAKSFIPEKPWNDSNPALNQSTSGQANIVGGGGGASSCAESTTSGNEISCNGGYAKPSWQAGTGVPTDQVRDIPDVSLFAANGANFSFYAICADANFTESGTADCVTNGGPNSLTAPIQISGVGGTSASSPAMAGILALIVQKYGRQGVANTVLYPLAAQQATAFHDVTVGTNAVACTAGSLDCGATGYLNGYSATTGYDQATGLGSVDANVLATKWNTIVTTPTTTTLTVTPTTVNLNDIVTFAVTVSGAPAGSFPTGDVAILTDTTTQGEGGQVIVTLPAGTNTVSIPYAGLPGTGLPSGPYQVRARYAGDGVHGSSTSNAVTVNVNPVASSIAFYNSSISNGNAVAAGTPSGSIPYGTFFGSAIPIPSSYTPPATQLPTTVRAHGSIVLTDNAVPTTLPLDSSGSVDYITLNEAVGAHSLVATYSGDSSYLPSAPTAPIAFTIVKAVNTTTLTPSATTVPAGGSITVTAAIATSSFGALPTGTVTFSIGTTALAPVPVTSTYNATTGTATASAVVTITASQLTAGTRIAAVAPQNRNPWWPVEGGLALASVLLFGIPARKRTWRSLVGSTLGAICLLILAGGLSACGGGGTPTPPPVTPTTSTITAVYSGDGNYATSTATAITISH